MIEKAEFLERVARLRAAMAKWDPDWKTMMLVGRVNQYYFTGSMQGGGQPIRMVPSR